MLSNRHTHTRRHTDPTTIPSLLMRAEGNNITLAKKFSYTMRYIDNLLTLNNSAFEHKICDVYSTELELKKTTECPTKLSYLDILVPTDNGKYLTAIFDRRDSFKFNIVNFPHMNSNIPSKPAYGVYITQLVR